MSEGRVVNKHPTAKPLYISYHSPISMEKLGIESAGIVSIEPTSDWMIVGVNKLFTREGKLDWFKGKEAK